MIALQAPTLHRYGAYDVTSTRAITIWADDEALLDGGVRLDVDRELPSRTVPVEPELRHYLDRFPRLGPVHAQLDAGNSIQRLDDAAVSRITEITALTCSHRIHPGGLCLPDYHRRTLVPVPSTSGVLPGRNIWPPSGAPLLLGFILRCQPDSQSE